MRLLNILRLRTVAFLLSLVPAVLMTAAYILDDLGANPVQALQLQTGRYALLFLVLTLACRPVAVYTGFKSALKLRRMFGLFTFFYATLHLLNFVWLDYGWDFGLIMDDLGTTRFILVGLAAWVILLALSVTSTAGWVRRLGPNWRRLHRFVYPAALLSVLHYIWAVKADLRAPLAAAGIVLVLLALRIPRVRALFHRR